LKRQPLQPREYRSTVFTLHCTKKLLDRIGPRVDLPRNASTRLGNWYATALFWRPHMALMVNERTLLPVMLPLAPAASLAKRFPAALEELLRTLGLPDEFIKAEIGNMGDVAYATTANRSVIGVMNMFAHHAEGYRDQNASIDPLALSLKLAQTPCGPLYKGAVFPDKAVRELVDGGDVH
jgi:hypothetical protein